MPHRVALRAGVAVAVVLLLAVAGLAAWRLLSRPDLDDDRLPPPDGAVEGKSWSPPGA